MPASDASSPNAPPGALQRRVWRAPQQDRTGLIAPPWSEAAALVAANQRLLSADGRELQGLPLARWRRWTREAALAAARDYTTHDLGAAAPDAAAGPILAGGHQPELFHPGVWAKNFALAALARRTGGVALNLIVDNDTLSATALRAPAGTREQPRAEPLPFDAPHPAQPWEEARIVDRGLWEAFGQRVADRMQSWNITPLATQAWPAAVRRSQQTDRLADCLTAARVGVERAWGLRNLELPLSRLCALPPFLWFVAHVLAQLPAFAEQYNAVVREYRVLNRVRSRSHPVPDLAVDGDWREAPFWVWRAGDNQRGRLFARQAGGEIELRDRRGVFVRLPLTPDRSADAAVEALQSLPAQGVRLRTRALTTTCFARLCLADCFVHGIGGAKYDEMTDALFARWFGLAAPAYLTVTATVRLPLEIAAAPTPIEVGALRHALHDLPQNPQRHWPGTPPADAAALIDEKRRLIAAQAETGDRRPAARRQRRERYLRLREINQELAARLGDQRRELANRLAAAQRDVDARRVLGSREYSWLLYPAEVLGDFLPALFPDDGDRRDA